MRPNGRLSVIVKTSTTLEHPATNGHLHPGQPLSRVPPGRPDRMPPPWNSDPNRHLLPGWRPSLNFIPLLFLLAGGLLAACSSSTTDHDTGAPSELHAEHDTPVTTASGIAVTNAWARATPPSATSGAAYFTITNDSDHADALLRITSPLAARVELHRTFLEDGLARMRPAAVIEVPAGASLKAEPGNLHVMLVDLTQPLVEGAVLPLELSFRTAGRIELRVPIRSLTAVGAPDHAGH